MGKHSPGATGAGQVKDGIHDVPEGVCAGPTGARAGLVAAGEQVADVVPLKIGEVAGVSRPCGCHAGRVTFPPSWREGRFLDGLIQQ